MNNALRQNFFRAGHAHAGVIVISAPWKNPNGVVTVSFRPVAVLTSQLQ
jgi:hypothetical protein